MSLNNEITNETSNEALLENSKKLLQDYKIIKQRLTQIITNHILPSDEAIEQALTIGLANRNIIEREVLEAELNEILALIPKDEKIISLILNELDNFDLQSSALEKAVAKSVRKLWIEKRVPQSTKIRFELSAKNEYAGILGLALFDDRNDEFYIKYATIEKTTAPFTTRVILAKGSAKNLAHANGGEFENIPKDYVLEENEYEGFLTSSDIYENDGTPQYMYHSLLYSFCKVSNDEPYRHFLAKSPAWFEIELKKMPLSKINFVGDKENSLSNIDNLEIFFENQSKEKTSILDMKSLELRSFEIKNYDYESEESILTKENLSAITNEIIEENLATKNFIDTKSEQNISGKKHFENIHVGGATEETHAANAKYVMDYVKTFFVSKIGKLEDLQTNAKDNLINSINEINSKIGNGGNNNTISGANVLIGENKPTVTINPPSIGSLYVDKINANLWMCQDNTQGLNVWLNLIDKSQIKPQTPKNIYKFNLLEAVGSAYGVCLSGVVLYDYSGQRFYLKAIKRDVSIAKNPTAFLLFTKEICESISENAELNEDYEVGENEMLGFITCEERYTNSTYYYPDYIFKPYNASDTLSYYMSSKKSGFVQIELFSEKNKLGKIEFRNGTSGRITSKLTLSYFTSDINAEIKEISTSEEFIMRSQNPMQMIYNPDLREKNYIVINNSSTKPPCCLSDLRFYKNDVLLKPKYVSVNEAGTFVETILSTDESLDAKPAEFFESIPKDYEIGENECKITLESLYGVYSKDYGLHKVLWQGLPYENGLYYYCVDRNNNFDAIKIKCEQGINIDDLNKISFINNIGSGYTSSYLTTDIKAQKIGNDGSVVASASLSGLTHSPQAYEFNLKGVEQ